jgi:8-oxo-dGTP diphosphatase
MFALIYQWYVKSGKEEECREAWNQVARFFVARRGALGSSLHRTSDGLWVAYSRWPDKRTQDASWPKDGASPSAELPSEICKAVLSLKDCLDPERKIPDICMEMEDQIENVKPRVGVGVFVFQDGKVLLGKRKGAHGAGDWAPPGGHLEFGESIEDCAIRELAEETGLKALSVKTGLWSNDVINESKHYITFFAVVDQFEGEPQLLEPNKCEEWQWFSLDALPRPLFLPANAFFAQYKSSYTLSH